MEPGLVSLGRAAAGLTARRRRRAKLRHSQQSVGRHTAPRVASNKARDVGPEPLPSRDRLTEGMRREHEQRNRTR